MVRVSVNKGAFDVALARRNLTQTELASEMHTNRQYLSQIVCGKRPVSPLMRQRLLDHLKGCRFDDLFVIEENGNGQ